MSNDKGMSLDEFIFRKLQPVRILRGYLVNELEMHEGDEIRVARQDLDNIVSTIEIFLEEYDRVSSFRGRRSERSSRRAATPAQATPGAGATPIRTIA